MARLNTAMTGSGGNGPALRVPVVRSREVGKKKAQVNEDSKFDRLELSCAMPLAEGEAIHSAKLLVFFNVKLSKCAKVAVPTLGYVWHESALAGEALWVDGNLDWTQTQPLPRGGGYGSVDSSALLEDGNLLPWTDGNQSLQNLLPNMLAEYRGRSYTTDLDSRYSLWTGLHPGTWAATATEHPSNRNRAFNLSTTFRYSTAAVTYTPAISEVLLDAWVRLLAVFVAVMWLLDRGLTSFIFTHHLLETMEIVDGEPPSAFRRFKTHLN